MLYANIDGVTASSGEHDCAQYARAWQQILTMWHGSTQRGCLLSTMHPVAWSSRFLPLTAFGASAFYKPKCAASAGNVIDSPL